MLSGLITFTFLHLLIMSVFLFFGKDKKSNFWLGIFFLILSAIMFMQLAYHFQWVYHYRYLNNTDYIYSALLGFIFYAYVCEVLKEKPNIWYQRSQYLLVGICVMHFIWFEFTYPTQADLVNYLNHAYIELPIEKNILNLLLYLNLNASLYFSYLVYQKKIKDLQMHFSQDMQDNLNWLKQILLVVLILNNILMPIFISLPKTEYFQMLSPLFFSCTYLFVFVKALQSPYILNNVPLQIIKENEEAIVNLQPNEEDYILFETIEKYMKQQQPYLEKSFSLLDLTEGVRSKRNQVSRALNIISKENFFNYVNRFRVHEAKILLLEENVFQQYTIESIGNKCGFGSKSSFYSTFKKLEGCSPQEYREKNFTKIKVEL